MELKEELLSELKSTVYNEKEFLMISRLLATYINLDTLKKYLNVNCSIIDSIMSLDLSKMSKKAIVRSWLEDSGVTSSKETSSIVPELIPIDKSLYNRIVVACCVSGRVHLFLRTKKIKELFNDDKSVFIYLPYDEDWKHDFNSNLESLSTEQLQDIYNYSYEYCPSLGLPI